MIRQLMRIKCNTKGSGEDVNSQSNCRAAGGERKLINQAITPWNVCGYSLDLVILQAVVLLWEVTNGHSRWDDEASVLGATIEIPHPVDTERIDRFMVMLQQLSAILVPPHSPTIVDS